MIDKIFGKKINFKTLINYQESSVVSKTILKNDCGTLTVFAFDMEQGLSEHTAPYAALVQVLEGEINIEINKIAGNYVESESVIMPPSVPHSLKAVKKTKILLTMLKSK